jgi:hypothetical protein
MSKAELNAARTAAAPEKKFAENNSEKASTEEEGECWRDRDGFWNDGGEPVGGWKRGDVHVLPTGDGTWAAQFCTKAKTKTADTQWNAFGGFATAAAARAAAEAEKKQTKNNPEKPPARRKKDDHNTSTPDESGPDDTVAVWGFKMVGSKTYWLDAADATATEWQIRRREGGNWQFVEKFLTRDDAEKEAAKLRAEPATPHDELRAFIKASGLIHTRVTDHGEIETASRSEADWLRSRVEVPVVLKPGPPTTPPDPPSIDETLAMLRASLDAGDMDSIRGVLAAWERGRIVRIVDGKNVQHWLGDRWAAHLSYHTEREAIMEAIEVAQIVYERKGE